ncbi:hypothetical protein [Leifsonia sp. NPDC058230]|uniref:hypothetical protein n=1 Tax=Leifsonia sp. NPDC058230 TaxID=3346391 RepID=UPI0036DF1464
MKLVIFVAGVAVGFVLGSKAGRQAYDKFRKQVTGFTQSPPVQQVASDVKDLAGKAAAEAGDRVSEVIDKASDKLDEVTGKGKPASPSSAS